MMKMYAINYIAIHSVDDDDKYMTDHQKVGDVFLYSVAETIRHYIRRIWPCGINSALTVDTTLKKSGKCAPLGLSPSLSESPMPKS